MNHETTIREIPIIIPGTIPATNNSRTEAPEMTAKITNGIEHGTIIMSRKERGERLIICQTHNVVTG